MKIKTQFTILVCLIVATPIICVSFLMLDFYKNSTNRYLIDGYKQVEEIEENNSDYSDALKIMSLIPEEVQSSLIDIESSKVICNSIPELDKLDSLENMWNILSATSKDYFYQFTSPKTEKKTIIITRIPRIKQHRLSNNLIRTLLIILLVCMTICVFSILIISRTIFNSIIKIKNETKKIANGNLNEVITKKNNSKNQNEIMSILESLEKMRQSLWEAENRKNKFIMGISHDLRTPVAIIKGYTEAITDKVLTSPEEIKEALSLIHVKTSQLENMINDLINYTKLNSYELKEQFTNYSITQLINDFAKDSKLSANVFKRDVKCEIDLNENISLPINKQLILRAFENIFSNALRYTNDGDTILIKSFIQDNSIILKISDSGIGIDEEDLPHIFDLFYRSSNSRQGGSMGIGLSVVKNILDSHGWKITVTSKKSEGTCFTIVIPIQKEPS